MAITAWSAKVLRSAICFSVNGPAFDRLTSMAPMESPSRSNGVAESLDICGVHDVPPEFASSGLLVWIAVESETDVHRILLASKTSAP